MTPYVPPTFYVSAGWRTPIRIAYEQRDFDGPVDVIVTFELLDFVAGTAVTGDSHVVIDDDGGLYLSRVASTDVSITGDHAHVTMRLERL